MARGKEQSSRNSRNSHPNRRGRGRWNARPLSTETVAPVAEQCFCDYCYRPFWRTNARQRYCDSDRERKPAMQRRASLVELLVVVLRTRCRVTVAVARAMVETAEAVLLMAVRRLGWLWDEQSKRFAYTFDRNDRLASPNKL